MHLSRHFCVGLGIAALGCLVTLTPVSAATTNGRPDIGICCDKGSVLTKEGIIYQCCKKDSTQNDEGKPRPVCCTAAGGVWRDGKCCKCRPQDNCGK